MSDASVDYGIDGNPTKLWEPIPGSASTNMDGLRGVINSKFNLKLECYKDLYKWSIDNYDLFWEEVLLYTNVQLSSPYSQIVDKKKNIAEIPDWFAGCRLNYAQNLLNSPDDAMAIISSREGGANLERLTFGQLKQKVLYCAAAMKRLGLVTGDRIVGYIPNCSEAVVAMLAAASFGAVWSSTSPDFGIGGVLDRFIQIKPKMIFSVNGVMYNGRVHDHLKKLKQVVHGLPMLEKVVVIHYVNDNQPLDLSAIDNSCSYADFLTSGKLHCASQGDAQLHYMQLPFSHPLYILYSSGTTGAPKCMVHSAGGTLLKHNEEHIIQGNAKPNDVIFYYTTTGWMMWNWLVGGLASGACIVLYDGSPLVPHVNVLWDLVDQLGITVLGTGAKWLSVLQEKGVSPRRTHLLTSLHTILSTGSPLKPETYDYVYTEIKKNVLLGSITGGTDIISCFAGQNWTVPVYRGEIQSPNLGSAIESWDEEGKSIEGRRGELVCTRPFPSMPTHFWNDPDGTRYKKAYFEKFPGVWAHGDFLVINPSTGGIVMLGRSDGTLNPNGVRFGSAEIYNVVEAFKEVQDSLCVAQRSSDLSEERVVLFLKMSPGASFNEEMVVRVKSTIRSQLSARHVPAVVLETLDIPYTISGKKVEVAVRDIIAGKEVANRGALANPESLDLYSNLPLLQGF